MKVDSTVSCWGCGQTLLLGQVDGIVLGFHALASSLGSRSRNWLARPRQGRCSTPKRYRRQESSSAFVSLLRIREFVVISSKEVLLKRCINGFPPGPAGCFGWKHQGCAIDGGELQTTAGIILSAHCRKLDSLAGRFTAWSHAKCWKSCCLRLMEGLGAASNNYRDQRCILGYLLIGIRAEVGFCVLVVFSAKL